MSVSTPLTANVACTPHQTPADLAAGGCSHAATEIRTPVHTHAAGVTDLRDHAIRLMQRRECYACADVAMATAKAAAAITLIIVFSPC